MSLVVVLCGACGGGAGSAPTLTGATSDADQRDAGDAATDAEVTPEDAAQRDADADDATTPEDAADAAQRDVDVDTAEDAEATDAAPDAIDAAPDAAEDAEDAAPDATADAEDAAPDTIADAAEDAAPDAIADAEDAIADAEDAIDDAVTDAEPDVEDVAEDAAEDAEMDAEPPRAACRNPSNPCCAADGFVEPEGTLCRAGARWRTFNPMDPIIWEYRCSEQGALEWLEATGRCTGDSATCAYDPTPDGGIWRSIEVSSGVPQFSVHTQRGCTCVDDGNGPYCDGIDPQSYETCRDPVTGFWSPDHIALRSIFRDRDARVAVCLNDGRIAWRWPNDNIGAFLCHDTTVSNGRETPAFYDVAQQASDIDFADGCPGFCRSARSQTCNLDEDCADGECILGACPNATSLTGWFFETCPDGKTCRTEDDGLGVYCGAPGDGCDPDSECCDAAGRPLPDGSPCGERSEPLQMCGVVNGRTALVEARVSQRRCAAGRCGHAEHNWRDPTEARNPQIGGTVEVTRVERLCDGDLACVGPAVAASCGQPWCADRYSRAVMRGEVFASCMERRLMCDGGPCCTTTVVNGVSVQVARQAGTPCPLYESCYDGVDNDGDGGVDCRDLDCEGLVACQSVFGSNPDPNVETFCDDGLDNDQDGLTDCEDADDCAFRAPCRNNTRRYCPDPDTLAVAVFEEQCPGFSNVPNAQGDLTVSSCVINPELSSEVRLPCADGLACGWDGGGVRCYEAPEPVCTPSATACCALDGLSFARQGIPCGDAFPDDSGPRGGAPYCAYNEAAQRWEIARDTAVGTCEGGSLTCRTDPEHVIRSTVTTPCPVDARCVTNNDGSGVRCLNNAVSVCDGGECCDPLGVAKPSGTPCAGSGALAEERRCALGGGAVERRQAQPGCNAADATCSTSMTHASWTDWEVAQVCGADQACEAQGTTATCVDLPATCDDGACCIDGLIDASTAPCGVPAYEVRYCLGADVYAARFERSCGGTSPACVGPPVLAQQALVQACDYACDDSGPSAACVSAPAQDPPAPCGTTCIIGGICPGEDRFCSASNRCAPIGCQACAGRQCHYDGVTCEVLGCEGDSGSGDPPAPSCGDTQGTLTRFNFPVGGTMVAQMEVAYNFDVFGGLLLSTPYRYWPATAGQQVPASTRIYVGIEGFGGSTWYTEFITNRPEPGEWSIGFPAVKDADQALCGGPTDPTHCLPAAEVQALWDAGFCVTGFIAAPLQ